MCYSALIKGNLKKVSSEFRARIDLDSFSRFYALKIEHPELKSPYGLDRYFLLSQDPEEAKIGRNIKKFHEDEKGRVSEQIKEAESEMKELAAKPTAANKKKIDVRIRKIEKLEKKLKHSLDQITPLDERIYPGVFAPVIIADGKEAGGRRIVPMRYRVRMPSGAEIPPQYNVFNARRDSLQSAATWKALFGETHAIFPFSRFFEWVERTDDNDKIKKVEIAFSPSERGMMWAASLYSPPKGKAILPYASFAMVTDEPPQEVAAAGHDRCPIFLREDLIDQWLHAKEKSKEELLTLLDKKEKTFYLHDLVA